ncbi:MAG: hypothetical protein ACLUES_08385 [Flavonifractor plautii]
MQWPGDFPGHAGAAFFLPLRRGEDPGQPGPPDSGGYRHPPAGRAHQPLDLRATEWLEEYLDRYKGTVLAISHDRWFLDRVVRRVIEIHDGKAEFYAGNYSFYVEEKERRYEEKLKQYEKEQAKLEQLQEAVDKLHLWAFMGNDKLHKRAFSIEKRMERIRTTDKPTRALRHKIRGERVPGTGAHHQGAEVL